VSGNACTALAYSVISWGVLEAQGEMDMARGESAGSDCPELALVCRCNVHLPSVWRFCQITSNPSANFEESRAGGPSLSTTAIQALQCVVIDALM